MKDFITKVDDDATDAGVVVADEYNSIFTEAKNAVKTFLTLNSTDNKQLQKAIDIASKAIFYTDAGTVNSVQLSRSATTETTETLFDGMVVYFTPANANTGATTLKVTTLTAKPLKFNGSDLEAGYLSTDSKYIAIYNQTQDRFDIDILTSGMDRKSLVKNNNGVIESLSGNAIYPHLAYLKATRATQGEIWYSYDRCGIWGSVEQQGTNFEAELISEFMGPGRPDETLIKVNKTGKYLVSLRARKWSSSSTINGRLTLKGLRPDNSEYELLFCDLIDGITDEYTTTSTDIVTLEAGDRLFYEVGIDGISLYHEFEHTQVTLLYLGE